MRPPKPNPRLDRLYHQPSATWDTPPEYAEGSTGHTFIWPLDFKEKKRKG